MRHSKHSRSPKTSNFLFDEEKFNDELKNFKEYDQAEEHVRSRPISLSRKLEILSENEILQNLRAKNASFS